MRRVPEGTPSAAAEVNYVSKVCDVEEETIHLLESRVEPEFKILVQYNSPIGIKGRNKLNARHMWVNPYWYWYCTSNQAIRD